MRDQKRTIDRLKKFNWRKKSILFELEYWVSLKLRHNMDVMHIEKNMCDSLFKTKIRHREVKKTQTMRGKILLT